MSPAALEAARTAARATSAFTLQVTRPLFWHIGARNGGVPHGASAFLLEFEHRLIGVTADHVLQQYLSALERDPRTICQLGACQIRPEVSVIARSESLDIATFEVDRAAIRASGGQPIDCRGAWPPPDVEVGDTLTLTGFLNEARQRVGPQEYTMEAWGGHGVADSVSDRDILTVYEPERVLQADDSLQKPPLGFNMSGCSGGLVLLVKQINGLLRWFPVGLIYKGPDGNAQGELASFDRIHVRRLHFVSPDGIINETDVGWLPS